MKTDNKRILPICLLLALLLAVSAFPSGCVKVDSAPAYTDEMTYAETLFDTSRVHTIDIAISESDWADLKANPTSKTKYQTSVTVDGEAFDQVSFSTKGNTSLTSVAGDADSDRYSFKLNFGKYDKSQTYRGLKKLNLNNLYADATYMKDYLSYELFRRVGVEAPLTSYVWLTVNGDAHGLYIAIEDVSESYLERTANGEGELYKPENDRLDMDNAGKPDGSGMPQMPDASGMPQMPDASGMPQMPDASGMPQFPGQGGSGGGPGGFPGGGFGDSSGGAALAYSDDELSSYPDIFDNAVTDADEEDELRVVAALKGLASGEDVDKYVDTHEVIRYFAAHNFVLNYDSYTGNMLHNYYLYERDGKLSMLPWDYNLAFGAFMGGGGPDADATYMVNLGIDTPLSGAEESERPMWGFIAENEDLLAEYHEVYAKLIAEYFDSGEFEKQFDSIVSLIRPYVKKDPSAFYTADEFEEAIKTLKSFILKRAESISLQLDGSLASRTDEQDAADRVDASGLDINSMGSHGGPGSHIGQEGHGQGFPGGSGFPGGQGFPGGPGGSAPGERPDGTPPPRP